jgi:hypothetical protein
MIFIHNRVYGLVMDTRKYKQSLYEVVIIDFYTHDILRR